MSNSNDDAKMNPSAINQDAVKKENQQRTDDSALDMMQGLHEHEDHSEDADDNK